MAIPSGELNKWEGIQILCEARVFAYSLLSKVFLREPCLEYLDYLGRDDGIRMFPFSPENEEIKAGIERTSKYLQKFKTIEMNARTKELEKLRWDYTWMFVGPYQLPAPPWESAYLNDERLLFQEETLAVRRFYLEYGFLPGNYLREADDHLGLELEFMYRLSEKTIEKLAGSDKPGARTVIESQARFQDEHLLKWVPRFARDVIRSASTDFYKGMASLLKGFIELDRQATAELMKAIA